MRNACGCWSPRASVRVVAATTRRAISMVEAVRPPLSIREGQSNQSESLAPSERLWVAERLQDCARRRGSDSAKIFGFFTPLLSAASTRKAAKRAPGTWAERLECLTAASSRFDLLARVQPCCDQGLPSFARRSLLLLRERLLDASP